MNKPCINCGTPAPGTHCPDHQPKDTRTTRDRKNNAQWKNMSKRLRRLSPFCEFCGATEQLSVDHILPVSDYPELTYVTENCRVLCKQCNGKRGNRFTATEAHHVLTRLQDAYRRRPTKSGRDRVQIAQRAALTRGEAPSGPSVLPGGKAQRAMKMAMIVDKRVPDAVG